MSSTKAWLEKMRTLFIRKGSGFSSRNVITGDCYKRINEVGIPVEVAQRITFEERVNIHNIRYLQKLVDEHLCLTYKEGGSTYSQGGLKGAHISQAWSDSASEDYGWGYCLHQQTTYNTQTFLTSPLCLHP